MLVVGQKEEEEGTVSVRTRAGGDQGAKSLDEFTADILKEIEEKVREKFSKETKTEDEESVFVDEQAEVTTEADNNAGETEA